MQDKVKKIGSFLTNDLDGFIVNSTSLDKIQQKWLPAAEMVRDDYIKHFEKHLHSVYIRGSVAKGEALEGISDLDTFAVVTLSHDDIDMSWSKDFEQKLVTRFPFIVGVEMKAIPLQDLKDRKGDRIMIKTQSICVYGENLADTIASLKPGVETAQHYAYIEEEIDKTKEWLENEHTEEEVKRRCVWIMKRVVRSGSELVMERSQKYTRDLYPCYEVFAEYYPEKKMEMYEALELAVEPTSDKKVILTVLDNFGGWLVKEIDLVF